jgi:cobalamin biosynthesis protein CobT
MAHGEMVENMRTDAERAKHINDLIEQALAEAKQKAHLEGMTDEEFDAAWEKIANRGEAN